MRKTVYEKVVVIGCGKMAGQVLEEVDRKREEYGYKTFYVEHEKELFGVTRQIASNLKISCCLIEDKKKLSDFFLGIEDRCLIISAGNNYLFPASVTDKPNYTIVNYHNALLPKYPGRNAPSWAIYEKEKETGITWHYVTSQIDGGDIIVQKKCAIEPDVRAYELAAELMQLAYKGFVEGFEAILEDRADVKHQNIDSHRKMYKSTECPGGGKFSLDDKPEDIYRLMRATDFGKYNIFPSITTEYQGKRIRIIRYRKIPSEKKEDKSGVLNLPLGDGFWLKLVFAELPVADIEGIKLIKS